MTNVQCVENHRFRHLYLVYGLGLNISNHLVFVHPVKKVFGTSLVLTQSYVSRIQATLNKSKILYLHQPE